MDAIQSCFFLLIIIIIIFNCYWFLYYYFYFWGLFWPFYIIVYALFISEDGGVKCENYMHSIFHPISQMLNIDIVHCSGS